jgi:DNA polymerase-3 subunit gamma/tau
MAKRKPSEPPPDETPVTKEGYTVLARRYRPQTFADLVGQEPVARALANAIKGNRVAHAYLFTGARGVGKTSTARILARALNCDQGPTDTPCGACPSCVAIATGEDVDVLEIDGASNRRIDEVREIRSNVQYRPSRARYKIYIVDEIHMLTKEAFNALLKTLEEPPPHVKFIFATTEVEKVPLTILSRCQRFDFPGIPLPRIVERLRAIVTREGLTAEDEALELVARRAGGSMRDAQSLLDQLLAFGGDRLTADQVHHLLGTASDDRVAALAGAVLARDPKRALELLDEAVVGGWQLGELLEQLIAYWRDLMVVHCAGTEGRDLSVPARFREALAAQARALSLDTILAGLDILSATKGRLRGSGHGRTLVEMALVRLGRLDDLVPLTQLTQWLGQPRTEAGATARPVAAAPVRVSPPEGVKKNEPPAALPADGDSQPGPAVLTAQTLPQVWPQIVRTVGTLLGFELEKAGLPAIFAPNTLVLRFPVEYNQSRVYCQAPERIARVEEVLRKQAGKAWIFRVEGALGTAPLSTEMVQGSESPVALSRPRRNNREEAEKEPLIKRALEVLGAQLIRVEEGFGNVPAPLPGRQPAAAEEEP